jgi:1-acyl-sn-glycerol-3-phosphate acyltransferase
MRVLRSALFLLMQAMLAVAVGLLSPLLLLLPRIPRWQAISLWARACIPLMRWILGITYRVEGLENLPKGPTVVLSKHQSAWETIAFQQIFPPMSFVLKRSLLWIPFFGWGLALFSPIAIDRGAGREALKQVEAQGRRRLQEGFWVLVFPEGTRTRYGESGKYQIGGPWLAAKAGVPVLPVAHNAGRLWPKNAFLKRPGQITVVIGQPIETAGRKANEVLAEVEAWIESTMRRL